MAQRCSKCRTMLPSGVRRCPTCGAAVNSELGPRDTTRVIFWYSVYILGIAMIPILVAILIGIVCTLLGKWTTYT